MTKHVFTFIRKEKPNNNNNNNNLMVIKVIKKLDLHSGEINTSFNILFTNEIRKIFFFTQLMRKRKGNTSEKKSKNERKNPTL